MCPESAIQYHKDMKHAYTRLQTWKPKVYLQSSVLKGNKETLF